RPAHAGGGGDARRARALGAFLGRPRRLLRRPDRPRPEGPLEMNLHNTLTGRVEPFAPAEAGEVRMYVCGPTVYGRAHIGNFRSFVATDLLRRTLRYKGWRVKEVMNLTDVDDKIIHFASQAGKDLRSFTEPHIRSFDEDRA